ncbi:MAG TPA: hypothetical protein VK081_07255 [Planctomycetota bacterium]|nr:hypothetical protein [Planctomycetota bacterium]
MLRVTEGVHAHAFAPADRAAFLSTAWVVSARCDRAGVRLQGAPLVPPGGGALQSEGMPRGAVEVAGDGEVIVVLPDGPTTGGYPVIACVATVDFPRLGQLRPREAVRMAAIDFATARRLLAEREAWLDREVPRP